MLRGVVWVVLFATHAVERQGAAPVSGTARLTSDADATYLSLVFARDRDTNGRASRGLSIVVVRGTDGVEEGRYASADGEVVVAYRGDRGGAPERATESTVTITEVRPDLLRGSYDAIFPSGREHAAFEVYASGSSSQ
jgi:hypothetical protein